MTEKNCTQCGETKPLTKFNKQKITKDGLQSCCRSCTKARSKIYKRSKHGLIVHIYGNQRSRSRNRKHPPPSYTGKELIAWFNKHPDFDMLFLNWENSGWDRWSRPSCDRIDDYKPYTLDNIRLVTWRENMERAHLDIKNGINNKVNKAVVQSKLDGTFVRDWYSIRQAEREEGFNHGAISQCCLGRAKSAGGFKWSYNNAVLDKMINEEIEDGNIREGR